MPPTLDPGEVQRLLRRVPLTPAPEGLWERIETGLASGTPDRLRRGVRPWLAAAAVILALVTGTAAGMYRAYGAPPSWGVRALAGRPTIAGTAMRRAGRLMPGEWMVTGAGSRARLTVGRIGVAEVGPNSRVRIERGGLFQHRLALERGQLTAAIAAPPRLFFVRTPSALATDLGCAYSLTVDSTGRSRLHVTLGWVELRRGDAASLVPAGMVAEVAVGQRPGTPYSEGFPEPARAALHALDAGWGGAAELAAVLGALHAPSDFITLRQESGITLWHLLQRLSPELRERVYGRLAALAPPPAGVTREGILALDRPMLERWRRELNPMWADEASSWFARAGRRLWEWAVQ